MKIQIFKVKLNLEILKEKLFECTNMDPVSYDKIKVNFIGIR